MANKHQVIHLHKTNPTWPAAQIAKALRCRASYVRQTLARNGMEAPRDPNFRRGRKGPRLTTEQYREKALDALAKVRMHEFHARKWKETAERMLKQAVEAEKRQ